MSSYLPLKKCYSFQVTTGRKLSGSKGDDKLRNKLIKNFFCVRSNVLVAFIWNFVLSINSRRKHISLYKAGGYLGEYYEVIVNSLHLKTKLWPRASFGGGGGGCKELWKFQVLLSAEGVKAQYCITLFFTLDLYYSEKLWHLRSWVFVFSYQKMYLVRYLIKTNSDYDSRAALHRASKMS